MGPSGQSVRALLRPPLWLAYSGLVLAVICVLLSPLELPGRVTTFVTASAAVAAVAGIALHRPRHRTAWVLIAIGLALSSVPGLVGRPRFAALYVLAQLIIMAALAAFVRERRAWPDRATTIDATIIAVAYASVTWLYLLGPYARSEERRVGEECRSRW